MLSQRQLLKDLKDAAETNTSDIIFLTEVNRGVPVYPYVMIYLIPGGRFMGPPLTSPEADAELVVQTSTVGATTEQALHAADDVREFFLGRDEDGAYEVLIPGVDQRRAYGGPPGVEPEGEPGERIYTVAERFILTIVAT